MRPVRSVLVYLAVVFVGGALLAPGLYFLAKQAASHQLFQQLAQAPFHRFVHRSILLLAIAGLWPLLRSLGIRRWQDIGIAHFRGNGGRLAMGFTTGFISLAIAAVISITAGARTIDTRITAGQLAWHLAAALLTACFVGIVEEILFRGALFGSIRRIHSWKTALVISSAVYAIVHFFAKPAAPVSVQWWTGVTTLGAMLGGFADVETLVPAFLNLALAGVILALAFQITGTLYFSIGLHAGWIFWLGFFRELTNGGATALGGSGKLIDGWGATFVLCLVLAGVGVWHRKSKTRINADVQEHAASA